METTGVMVLTCSTRPGALGPTVADWLVEAISPRAEQLGAELTVVSLAELDLPFLDEEEHPAAGRYQHEHTKAWSRLVDSVDGIIVVTPEYNYGMPAALKNALDFLGREWAWKPMGFVSYGNTSAGTRAVQHAKQVVTTLRLVPLGATVAIRIGDSVQDGVLVPDAAREEAAIALLDELVELAHALRPMRALLDPAVVDGPLPGSHLAPLSPREAAQVLVLQRCCWVEEARSNQTFDLAALHEGLEDVSTWLATWQTWGLWHHSRLVGMARGRQVGADWEIGRLAVAPDLRGRGVGRWLLRHALEAAPAQSRAAILHTGARSSANIALYRSEGFVPVETPATGEMRMLRSLTDTPTTHHVTDDVVAARMRECSAS